MSGYHNITDTSIIKLAECCHYIKESNINNNINARIVMHMVILKFKLLDFACLIDVFQKYIYVYVCLIYVFQKYISNINDNINAKIVMNIVILKFKLLDFVAPLADFSDGESVGGGLDAAVT
jgi:hypothetical protein